MNKKQLRYIKKKSKLQEEDDAKFFGGKPRPGSGNHWAAKGDAKVPNFLIEDKYTDKDYYSFNVNTWKKIENEALHESLRIPLLRVDLQDKEGNIYKYVIAQSSYIMSLSDSLVWDESQDIKGKTGRVHLLSLHDIRRIDFYTQGIKLIMLSRDKFRELIGGEE